MPDLGVAWRACAVAQISVLEEKYNNCSFKTSTQDMTQDCLIKFGIVPWTQYLPDKVVPESECISIIYLFYRI